MTKEKNLSNVTDLREKDAKDSKKAEPAKAKPAKKKGIPWKLIIIGIIILLLTVNGVSAYGIYGLGWNNNVTKKVVKIFPYPAVILKGGFITINDYLNDLDSYKKYYEVAQKTDFKSEEGQKIFKTLKEDLLNQKIEDHIIKQESKKLNLKIENSEVDEAYKKLAEENGEETLKKQIKDYYNWDVKTFKDKIKIMLLGKKLEEKIKSDEELNKGNREKTEEILKKLKNGEDFAKLAKELSEDPSAAEGGSLGWSEKGKNIPEIEDVAFSLKPGELSNVIKTTDGFYVVKVNDKKENEISISMIYIKSVDFENWLKQKETEYKVKRLLNLDKIKS